MRQRGRGLDFERGAAPAPDDPVRRRLKISCEGKGKGLDACACGRRASFPTRFPTHVEFGSGRSSPW